MDLTAVLGLSPGAAEVNEFVDLLEAEGQGGGDDVMAAELQSAGGDVVHALHEQATAGANDAGVLLHATADQLAQESRRGWRVDQAVPLVELGIVEVQRPPVAT